MLDMLTPAARASYAAYIDHLKCCTDCPAEKKRCAQAQALVETYLADLRKS